MPKPGPKRVLVNATTEVSLRLRLWTLGEDSTRTQHGHLHHANHLHPSDFAREHGEQVLSSLLYTLSTELPRTQGFCLLLLSGHEQGGEGKK